MEASDNAEIRTHPNSSKGESNQNITYIGWPLRKRRNVQGTKASIVHHDVPTLTLKCIGMSAKQKL